jgi:hypothetical protein
MIGYRNIMRNVITSTFLGLLFISFCAGPASAAVEKIFDYPTDSIFQTVFRFVSLDKKFKIAKEDTDIGLIEFTYDDNGVVDRSSNIEMIRDAAGPGKTKIRISVPSISDTTLRMLLEQLSAKIESDFGTSSTNEAIFKYGYDKLYPSISRFLVVDKKAKIKESNREKGFITFIADEGGSSVEVSTCEIIKLAQGGYKVRITIPSLASTSISLYLNGITAKLKSDYPKEE